VPVCNGIGGAGFDAIAAKNAPRVINVVDAGVAFTGGNSLGVGILGGFDINTIRGAGGGAPGGSDDGGRDELRENLASRASRSRTCASNCRRRPSRTAIVRFWASMIPCCSQTWARRAAFSRSTSSMRSSRQSRATVGEREATLGIMQASEHVVAWHWALDQPVRPVNAYHWSRSRSRCHRPGWVCRDGPRYGGSCARYHPH